MTMCRGGICRLIGLLPSWLYCCFGGAAAKGGDEVVVGWSCEVEVQPRSFELTLDFNFKGIVQLQRYPARGRSAHVNKHSDKKKRWGKQGCNQNLVNIITRLGRVDRLEERSDRVHLLAYLIPDSRFQPVF